MSIYEDGGNRAERVKASTIFNVDGSTEGRDPRKMTIKEFTFLGHHARPILNTIRAKCLDCSCYQPSEIAKCTAYGCALWPYRMGTNPFRAPMSEERRAAAAASLASIGKNSRKIRQASEQTEEAATLVAGVRNVRLNRTETVGVSEPDATSAATPAPDFLEPRGER